MLVHEQMYTIEEFEAFVAAHPEQVFELINGRIVEKVTSEEHGYIVLKIGNALLNWRKAKGIKGIPSTEATHRLPDDKENERRPDVSFRLTTEKVSKATALYQMPDFAVEVKSLKNTYDELREKARFYLANGSRLVWLVYPNRRIVEVYFANGTSELYKDDESLSGEDVLPDFEMEVSEIFDL
jgi:Uma2 family endonuclease